MLNNVKFSKVFFKNIYKRKIVVVLKVVRGMRKFIEILVLLVLVMTFSIRVEAKTYTNNEYQFSLWVPEEMLIFNGDSFTLQTGKEVTVVKGKMAGLNLEMMLCHTANVDGEEFSSLNFVKKFLDNSKQLNTMMGFDGVYYYNNPCSQHYYPVVVRTSTQQDFASAETNITVHQSSITILVNGSQKYIESMKKVLDSFKCLCE